MNRTADAHARQKKHIRQRVHDSATGYLNLLEVGRQCLAQALPALLSFVYLQDQIHRPGYMDRRMLMPNSSFKRFVGGCGFCGVWKHFTC